MKRSYREYTPKTPNPIEQAEQKFIKKMNNILGDLAVTIAEMPYKSLPSDLQQLVGQMAKGYVVMTEGARAYARNK